MASALYYVTHRALSPGTVIRPGNWGRVILSEGPAHVWFYREMAFEAERRHRFPEVPSRMTSAYAFDVLTLARQWASEPESEPDEAVYQVKALPGKIHRADMAWVTVMRSRRTFADVEGDIQSYWAGRATPNPAWEVLAEGGLEVVAGPL